MGQAHSTPRVLLITAVFSRRESAVQFARARLVAAWGPIALESPQFDFVETDYYEPTMGAGLKKCFWAFEQLIDPGKLAELKIATNRWEAEFAAIGDCPESRPLNIDPGYVTPAKLVLASTKDYAHRIYLGSGIFAEITLYFRQRRWQAHEWTFPDYRRADYQAFFDQCRDLLRAEDAGA